MRWGEPDRHLEEQNLNLSKITDSQFDTAIIIFPYNQAHLFELDKEDWEKILKDTKNNAIIIASSNGLKKSKPDISAFRLLTTLNEMIFNYWKEIRVYLAANPNIKYIRIVSSDINKERIERDYHLVFSDKKYIIEFLTVIIPNCFWKTVYQIRERLVLALPIWLYKALGKFC